MSMEYRTLAYVNKPVSKIVFGCANADMTAGKRVTKLLDAAYKAGINTFDTAENYGKSEIVLGKWIKRRKLREQVVIITKGCHPHGGPRVTAEALKEDLEQSLKRLKTDYIDIYMLHRDDPQADVGAIVEVLNAYHKAGKIRAFGASNWTHERIAEANRYANAHGLVPFTVTSPNFGLARQVHEPWTGCVSLSGPENEEARKWYEEQKIAVFAYSCLGRGLFSGKVKTDDLENTGKFLDNAAVRGYWSDDNLERLARAEALAKKKGCSVAQLTLAWIMQQKLEAFPIVTISDVKRIAENVDAVNITLSEEELQELMK